ncbi:MAG: hypothetical protein N4A65_00470 [Cohaesibacter sp.]|jgi:hypothetical protein|nr:hypothetical protein [Cohaesibacter sp.]
MKNGTHKIISEFAKGALEADAKSKNFVPSSSSEEALVAQRIADKMQELTELYIRTMTDLASETIDLTGCGNFDEVEEFRECTRDQIDQNFLISIREQAYALEAQSIAAE